MGEVGFEEVEFRDDEENADRARNEVGYSIEEEEIRCLDCHDEHDPACHNDREKSDDIEYADNVQDDVAWTGQLSIEVHVEHFGGVLKSEKSCVILTEWM